MVEAERDSKVNTLKYEVESWRPFVNALRSDEREVANVMIERCWRYAAPIESSRKTYLVEPLFLTILLNQEKTIRWLESEVKVLTEQIEAWKKGGS